MCRSACKEKQTGVCLKIIDFAHKRTLLLINQAYSIMIRQVFASIYIGLLSQLGYVVAYTCAGIAADSLGRLTGKGVGRGTPWQ